MYGKAFGFVACAGVVLGAAVSRADITFNPPTGANYVPHVDCPHGTPGFTDLKPLAWNSAETLATLNYQNILNARLPDQFPGNWSYQLNYDLVGTLDVGLYKAVDGPGACEHGADFEANLGITGGLLAGHEFAWLQVFSETGHSGSRTWAADPPNAANLGTPEDPDHMDSYPFYYNYAGMNSAGNPVVADDYYDETAAEFIFRDYPYDLIDDDAVPHPGSVSFQLMLASWDATFDAAPAVNNVQVYGMLDWGYTYDCIPAPPTLIVLGVLAVRRRRGTAA